MITRRDITGQLGITGVEANHILNVLSEHNVDADVIDWKTIGENIRDHGDRYGATWQQLEMLYGLPRPVSYDYQRYKQGEYEFNAMELKRHLMEKGSDTYQRVMHSICGEGSIPNEVNALITYTGKEKAEFLNVLCADYTAAKSTQVTDVERAVEKYRSGIERFGVDNYIACGELGGWYATAQCLHFAKNRTVNIDNMVKCYSGSA